MAKVTFINRCAGVILVDALPQPAIACSKLTIEALKQSVKYVQS